MERLNSYCQWIYNKYQIHMKELQINPSDLLPNSSASSNAQGIQMINITNMSQLELEAFKRLLRTGVLIRGVYSQDTAFHL